MTRLSVFYSLTHNCYRVDYTGRYTQSHGFIDGHYRMHICSIELKENVNFPDRLRLFHKPRTSLKHRLSRILFNLSVKLNPPNTEAYRKAPKRRWWQ